MIAYSEHFGPTQATSEDEKRILNQSPVPVTTQKNHSNCCFASWLLSKMYGFCKLTHMWKSAPRVWEEGSLGGIYIRQSWQLTILIQLKQTNTQTSCELTRNMTMQKRISTTPVNYRGQSTFRANSCVPAAQLLDSDSSIYISTF